MALALISEKLLEIEIKKLSNQEELTESQKFYLSMAHKELSLLKKINIECNLRGTEQEVEDRLRSDVLWLVSPDDMRRYKNAYDFYDKTKRVIIELDGR